MIFNNKQKCGFHSRMVAAMIDSALLGVLLFPLFLIVSKIIYGNLSPSDVIGQIMMQGAQQYTDIQSFISFVFKNEQLYNYMWNQYGAIKVILDQSIQLISFLYIFVLFWNKKQATPGKMIMKMKIVDYKTGGVPTTKQFILRFFGYIISALPMFMGFIWIMFNKNKRGWHDLISGTQVVSYTRNSLNK